MSFDFNKYRGQKIRGSQINHLDLVKIINSNENHNGYIFASGYNKTNGKGFRVILRKDIAKYNNYGNKRRNNRVISDRNCVYSRDVTIADDESVFVGNGHFRCNNIKLGNREAINYAMNKTKNNTVSINNNVSNNNNYREESSSRRFSAIIDNVSTNNNYREESSSSRFSAITTRSASSPSRFSTTSTNSSSSSRSNNSSSNDISRKRIKHKRRKSPKIPSRTRFTTVTSNNSLPNERTYARPVQYNYPSQINNYIPNQPPPEKNKCTKCCMIS
jgi:hypothetical protein